MRQPAKLTAAEQQIISLGRVLQILREEDNVDVLIATTISYLKESLDYKLLWIALYDRFNHVLVGKGGVIPNGDTGILKQHLVINPGDLFEQVISELRPLGVADLRSEPRAEAWRSVAFQNQIQGAIAVPIRHKEDCLGVLMLGSERWGYLINGEDKARLMIVVGELGAVLHQQENASLYKSTTKTDEMLLKLLDTVRSLNNLEQRLEAVVDVTHQFVSPTRTHIYWFKREENYFWRRKIKQTTGWREAQSNTAKIFVHDIGDFYYALSLNQVVTIGEGYGSLKSFVTGKLLQSLSMRSLMAAPIIYQKDLLGFLAVESNEPRIWSEAENNFLKGAAGLISLVFPQSKEENIIEQIKADAELSHQIARGIWSEQDGSEILHHCAKMLLQRLQATRFLLLQYDPERYNYQIFFQSQPANRKNIAGSFELFKEVDLHLLQSATEAIAIDNLDSDLRFYNWHDLFLANGVRSLLIGNCSSGKTPEALLIIANDTNRCWTTNEKQLVWVVSQQLGIVARQWQLNLSTSHQKTIVQSFLQCLQILSQAQTANLKTLERTALEKIASILGSPIAILLSWRPGDSLAKITYFDNSQFEIIPDEEIPLLDEAIVQWAIATQGLLSIKAYDLPPQTQQWLKAPGIGEILLMALRTVVEYEPTAIILIADYPDRQWSEQSLNAVEILITQLAWSRRWLQVSQILQSKNKDLRDLNWYKHRRFEDIQRTIAQTLNQMYELGIPKDELTHMRYQQQLRQLDNANTSMNALLKREQWQLQIHKEAIPITSLLKRSLERVDNLLKLQKIWVGVHGLGQPLSETKSDKSYSVLPQSSLAITGDIAKIELIVYELLIWACLRSTGGGRIDIWCRRLDRESLEVSITDNGIIDSLLMAELNQNTPQDVLAPSALNQLPGLHLVICQNLIQEMEGELHFYQLPDGRVVSRLLLPLSPNPS